MIVEWFTPPRRAYEWFGETQGTLAAIAAQGMSAVATVIGPQGPAGASGSAGVELSASAGNVLTLEADGLAVLTYTHTQGTPSAMWTVNHNLSTYPAVTVMDSGGSEVEGDIQHTSVNQTVLMFTAAFSGKARFI